MSPSSAHLWSVRRSTPSAFSAAPGLTYRGDSSAIRRQLTGLTSCINTRQATNTHFSQSREKCHEPSRIVKNGEQFTPGYGLSYIDPSCAIIGGPFRESDARDMAAKSNGGEPTDELSSLALLARAAIVSTATGDFVDVGDKADAGSTVQLRVMRSVDACGRSIWVSGALSETDAYRVRPLRAACNGTAPMLPMRISLLRIRSCEHDCVLHYLRSFGKRLVERGIVISTCYHASLDAKVAVDRYRHEIAARMPLNSIHRQQRVVADLAVGAHPPEPSKRLKDTECENVKHGEGEPERVCSPVNQVRHGGEPGDDARDKHERNVTSAVGAPHEGADRGDPHGELCGEALGCDCDGRGEGNLGNVNDAPQDVHHEDCARAAYRVRPRGLVPRGERGREHEDADEGDGSHRRQLKARPEGGEAVCQAFCGPLVRRCPRVVPSPREAGDAEAEVV